MDSISTFFFIYFLLILPSIIASNILNCPPSKCHNNSDLTIQFPFHIHNQQPKKCGLSGFELNCNKNTTTLHFPSYGDLVVKSISYDLERVDLLDPKNCVHEVFLNLNLSETPFRYYYVLKEYKYFKCLAELPAPNYIQVPCLSGSGFHFYVVDETFVSVPTFCQHVKSVAIPFAYSPYLNDNSFGLRLTWKINGSDDGFIKALCVQVSVVAMFILVAMVLHYAMAFKSKKLSSEEIEMDINEVKVEALLGEYEAFSSPKGHSMFHAKLVDDFNKYQLLKGMR